MKKNLLWLSALVSVLAVYDGAMAAARVYRSSMYDYDNNANTSRSARVTTTNSVRSCNGNCVQPVEYVDNCTTSDCGYSRVETYNNDYRKTYTTRTTSYKTTEKRKYYLAHPFYQPLQGKFGSLTDVSYTNNSFRFDFEPGSMLESAGGADTDIKSINVKEDFSIGITDKIALMGMLKYNSDKIKFKWDHDEEDEVKDSGLNMFGLGLQGRIVDTDEWISMLSGYFEHQKDMANYFIGEFKAGYKVARTTIYGLGRLWLVDIDGNSYGLEDTDGVATIFLAYSTDVDQVFYAEGGLGVFSVLDEDWTLNLEAIFGHYDWHNQGIIKGAIGFQPNDWFALNFYAKTSVYDSADGKDIDAWYQNLNIDDRWQSIGTKLSDVSEWTVGVQLMLEF